MKVAFSSSILLLALNLSSTAQTLEDNYIVKWKDFYPSKALSRGMHASIFQYEDRSAKSIQAWLQYNKEVKTQIAKALAGSVVTNRIDLRLLKVQVQSEIDRWELELPQSASTTLYTSLISRALKPVIDAEFLTDQEKGQLLCERMKAIQQLSSNAVSQLSNVSRGEASRSLSQLESMANFLKEELPNITAGLNTCPEFGELQKTVTQSVNQLTTHIKNELLPNAKDTDIILGRSEYARRLALYTDSDLTPEELSQIALEEIRRVKELMLAVSKQHLRKTYAGKPLPKTSEAVLKAALDDMQKDVPTSGSDYLNFWQELSKAATEFIEKQEIATLPKNETLRILPAPESAGAAARIGWVDSAPPFDPNPITTLYLPSIPETLPKQEQIDFWASFNKPFNRIIVIHELFPGHYMQMKISRESPHPVRLLFPYGIYTEGWATFCERVALDNGWEEGNHLSMLAHLRKRLENANRAYTSMQVHCNNWTQDQVMNFSTNTSLVAPQFAKSLWGRIMRSPMQLTSYFLGGSQFTELLASEKKRLGDQFDLKYFMDTIMKAGPIPIDEFPEIFNPTTSR